MADDRTGSIADRAPAAADEELSSLAIHRLLGEIFLLLDDGDHQVLRPLGLSVTQFHALRHLHEAGTLTVNELSARLLTDKSNASRLLARMEARGLVSRVRDRKDRRVLRLWLTPQGAKLLEEARAVFQRSVAERLAALSAEDRRALEALLNRLRDRLEGQLRGR